MRCFLLAAALTVLSVVASARQIEHSAEYGAGLGVNVNTYSMPVPHYGMIRNAGIRYIRRDMAWSEVEQTLGVYRWHTFDRLVAETEASGRRMMFILDYSNKLYSSTSPRDPLTIQAYANFARAAVERYKGRGIVWEVWNEPNHPVFWKPVPNIDEYFALAKAACIAIRQVAPREMVIAPALSGVDFEWLEGLFQRGLLPYIDGVSVHPYRAGVPETVLDDYAKLRALIARYNNTNRDIVIVNSEWGVTPGFLGHLWIDQEQHPIRIYFAALLAKIPISIHFNWIDLGTDQTVPYNRFGLLTTGLKTKRSYARFKFYNDRLSGYRFVSRLHVADDREFLLLFTNGTDEQLVAYTSRDALKVDTAPASAAFFDYSRGYGDFAGFQGTNTGLKIPFDLQPAVLKPRTRSTLLRYAATIPGLPDSVVVYGTDQGVDLLGPLLEAARSSALPALTSVTIEDQSTSPQSPLSLTRTYSKAAIPVSPQNVRALVEAFPFVRDTSSSPRVVTVTVRIGSFPALVYRTRIFKPDPRDFALSPTLFNQSAILEVKNESGRAFKGELRIGNFSTPIDIARGVKSAHLRVNAPYTTLLGGYTARIVADRESEPPLTIFDAPRERVVLHEDFRASSVGSSVSGWSTRIFPKSGSTSIKATARTAPGGLPFPGAKAAELVYRVAQRTQDVQFYKKSGTKLPRIPTRMSCWIHGDNSGHFVTARFKDRTGRYFQIKGVPIDFTGWRLVHWDLTRDFESQFGGVNTGGVAYPITLEQTLLVKVRTSTAPLTGRLYFAGLSVFAK